MHALPADARRPFLNSQLAYVAAGAAAFLISIGAQYAIYARVLAPGLNRPDPRERTAALKRWLVLTAACAAVVVGACLAYFFLGTRNHPPGAAWIAPPLGAVLGSALALQLAAARVARAAAR